MMIGRKGFMTGVYASLMFAGLTLGTPAHAQKAWISVPSTPTGEDSILITGGGLPPSSAFTLIITHPNGMQTKQVEATDAKGNLQVNLPLGTPGGYAVKVINARGKTVGGGRFGYVK